MYFKFVLLAFLSITSQTLCFTLQQEFTELAAETDTQLATVQQSNRLYSIEGRVLPPETMMRIGMNWQRDTTVAINDDYKGFVRKDGHFIISGVPPGSYVLEVLHADLLFTPVRVDITQKGKIRARKLSYIQPSRVVLLRYPLRLRPLMRRQYFEPREEWHFMELLLNPMVAVMVLPFVLMFVMSMLSSEDIDNIQMPKVPNEMPDLSEWITKALTTEQGSQSKAKRKATETVTETATQKKPKSSKGN